MSFEIIFTETSLRELKKLERNVQVRIISVLERIRYNPEKYIKRLRGREEYRLRVGDYRVILYLDRKDKKIFVLEVGHRRNIYR